MKPEAPLDWENHPDWRAKVTAWHPCPDCHPGPMWDADEDYELHCLTCGEHCDLCHCEARPCEACQMRIENAPNEMRFA